ncbi:7070_t:CDS:10 [Ambispora gerdemannii]|uniref:7070_t:CDS:1 n=1 Tax=Ambispora gerdemannii TaxID=144530 RepID=A0A9N8WMB3_9GLOM|nr:7070_t:CDS:10 [Ambispora gerdemannii]
MGPCCSRRIYDEEDGKFKFRFIGDRRYHGLSDSEYFGPNDDEEAIRLISYHKAMKDIWGGLFNSPIEEKLKQGARVVDFGCGTGTWILDMANQYPNSKFVGVDLSPLFPKEAQWEEKVIPEMIRLTRPDGWIEILESDAFITSDGNATQRIAMAFQNFMTPKGMNCAIGKDLPHIFENTNAFSEIKNEQKSVILGKKGGKTGQEDSKGNVSCDIFSLDLPRTPSPQYLNASNPEFNLVNSGDFEGIYLSNPVAIKNYIYVFGGQGTKEGTFKNDFYKIRMDSSPIIIERLNNTAAPSPRERLTLVTDKEGKIYIFGGWDGTGKDNAMYIFDSNNGVWTMVRSKNAPDMIWGYAPVFTDDRILYIGGNHYASIRYMPFDSIPVFNIKTNDWERINTTTDMPVAGRCAHVVILDNNKKRVIVYGGDIDRTYESTNGGLAILDLLTKKWTQPNIEGKRPDYIPFRPTATYFNDYIFVAFGKRNDIPSAEFNILDIYNDTLKWVER